MGAGWMRLHTAWLSPAGNKLPRMIAQKADLLVLFFGWIGLLLRGAPIMGCIIGGLSIVAWSFLAGSPLLLPWIVLSHVGLSAFATSLRGCELSLTGWNRGPEILAETRNGALLRYADLHAGKDPQS